MLGANYYHCVYETVTDIIIVKKFFTIFEKNAFVIPISHVRYIYAPK